MLKYILGAAALTFAAPVFAQSAPVADPHAGHAQHAQAAQTEQQGRHAGHAAMMMDCCKKCCEDSKADAKMDCCDKPKEGAPEAPAGHQH